MPCFVDTNVLVYCTDIAAPQKQARARDLVERLTTTGEAVVSTQVLIELFNVLVRRQRMPAPAAQALTLAYAAWPVVPSDAALVQTAMQLSIAHDVSIWDAMVIEAAQRAGAQTLYTEDLNHGQRFGKLKVVNPFLG